MHRIIYLKRKQNGQKIYAPNYKASRNMFFKKESDNIKLTKN